MANAAQESEIKALKRKREGLSSPTDAGGAEPISSAEDSDANTPHESRRRGVKKESPLVFQQCSPAVLHSRHESSSSSASSSAPVPIRVKSDHHWLELVNKAALLWDNKLLNQLIAQRKPGTIRRIEEMLRIQLTHGKSVLSERFSHPLYLCAKNNNLEGVRMLLDTGECTVDFTNRHGISPLYISCHYGNAAVVDLLCSHGARIDLSKKQGGTCVNTAVKHGCLSALKSLVEHGADLRRMRHRGESFLHVAARYGHADIVRYLVDEHRIDIDIRSPLHMTALQIACRHEQTDVARVLLQRECALLQNAQSVDRSEIHTAARSGNLNLLVQIISHLERTPNVPQDWINLRTADNATTPFLAAVDGKAEEKGLAFLLLKGASPRARQTGGYNAVMLATRKGREHLLPMLYSVCGRAILREETDGGYNAVEIACRNKNLGAVEKLLELNPELLTNREQPHSALYIAAKVNHLGIVKLLVEKYKVDVNEQRVRNTTPVQVASKGGHVAIVKYLLEHGATLDAQGHSNAAFLSACNHDRLQVVKYLVERKGCEIALTRGEAGWTGIHVASRSGNMELLRFLCEKLRGHADISAMVENGGGYTALHVAAYHGQLDVVRYLCSEVGISVNAKSVNKQHTALYLASRRGQDHVVAWLNRAKAWSRLELYVEARNHSQVFRLLNEGLCGPDPFHTQEPQNRDGATETAMDIASRGPSCEALAGPWLPVCQKTVRIVWLATQSWIPANHALYPPKTRVAVNALLLSLRRKTLFPRPIQYTICSFFADRSCSANVQQP